MRPFVVSPSAAEDLHTIWTYLALEASPSLADATLVGLARHFAGLAEHPGKGHVRQDLTLLPLHFFAARPYLIVYQRDASPLAIHAVLHSSRNIGKLLQKRPLS